MKRLIAFVLVLLIALATSAGAVTFSVTTYNSATTGMDSLNTSSGFRRTNLRMCAPDYATMLFLYQATGGGVYRVLSTADGGSSWVVMDTAFAQTSNFQPYGGIWSYGTDVYAASSSNSSTVDMKITQFSGATLVLIDTVDFDRNGQGNNRPGIIERSDGSLLVLTAPEVGTNDSSMSITTDGALSQTTTYTVVNTNAALTQGNRFKLTPTAEGMLIAVTAAGNQLWWVDATRDFVNLGTSFLAGSGTGGELAKWTGPVRDSFMLGGYQSNESLFVVNGYVEDNAGDAGVDAIVAGTRTLLEDSVAMPKPALDTNYANVCFSCLEGTDTCVVLYLMGTGSAGTPVNLVAVFSYDGGATWSTEKDTLFTGASGDYYNYMQAAPTVLKSGGTMRVWAAIQLKGTQPEGVIIKADATWAAAPTTMPTRRRRILNYGEYNHDQMDGLRGALVSTVW